MDKEHIYIAVFLIFLILGTGYYNSRLIDQKLSDISINLPKIKTPKPRIILNIDENTLNANPGLYKYLRKKKISEVKEGFSIPNVPEKNLSVLKEESEASGIGNKLLKTLGLDNNNKGDRPSGAFRGLDGDIKTTLNNDKDQINVLKGRTFGKDVSDIINPSSEILEKSNQEIPKRTRSLLSQVRDQKPVPYVWDKEVEETQTNGKRVRLTGNNSAEKIKPEPIEKQYIGRVIGCQTQGKHLLQPDQIACNQPNYKTAQNFYDYYYKYPAIPQMEQDRWLPANMIPYSDNMPPDRDYRVVPQKYYNQTNKAPLPSNYYFGFVKL